MKTKLKKIFIDYIPMALTAVLIIVSAIINNQSFIKTLPTLVTLIVQLMSSRANRYAFLIGGTNAILYSIAPFSEGLYFSVMTCLCISSPIQYFSFFVWKRKKNAKDPQKTELRFLGIKKCIVAVAITVAVWVPFYWLSKSVFNGTLAVLDSFSFVWSITMSFLSAFRYIESQYLNILGCVIGIVTWTIICMENPNNLNYLVISYYNLIMVIKAVVNWTRQYINDKREKELCQ